MPARPTRGRADLERLRSMTEEEIKRTSPPELRDLPDGFWDHAKVVWPVGNRLVQPRWWHRNPVSNPYALGADTISAAPLSAYGRTRCTTNVASSTAT